MGEWRTVRLGDVTTNHDAIRKPVKSLDRQPGPFPYYGASGIVDYIDDYILDGEYLLVSEDGENLRSRKTFIAFVASGKFWVNNHAHVLRGNESARTRFLKYRLDVTDISGYLTGSTQPKLSQQALNNIQVAIPDVAEQDAILAVLDSLDSKISANQRTCWKAEELALAVVGSFAHNARKAIHELARCQRTVCNPWEQGDVAVRHFSLPAFDQGRHPAVESSPSIKSAKFVLDKPSVLFSKLNPRTPRIWLAAPDKILRSYASTEFVVLQPYGYSPELLWLVCAQPHLSDELVSLARGTSNSHQRVTPSDILERQVIDPGSLSSIVVDECEKLIKLSMSLHGEIPRLVALRDTLLPKLMDGTLAVRAAEDLVSEVV